MVFRQVECFSSSIIYNTVRFHISAPYSAFEIILVDLPSNHGGSLYDGTHQVLYWADVLSEMAFVVPSLSAIGVKKSPSPEKDKSSFIPEGGTSRKRQPPEKPLRSNMTLNLDKTGKNSTSRHLVTAPFEVKGNVQAQIEKFF